jgi:hypothetical protein
LVAVQRFEPRTSQFLKKLTGLEVSQKKVHQIAVEEGRRIER